MNSAERRKCEKIISQLMREACAQMFLEAPTEDIAPDYDRYVHKPMYLTLVQKKLKQGRYGSVSQCDEDVKLILTNSIKYNGEEDLVTKLCKILVSKWRKLKAKYFPLPIEQLSEKYCQLIGKIDKLLAAHPKRQGLNVFDCLKRETGERQVELQKALSAIDSKEKKIQLMFLLRELEPNFRNGLNELHVNLTDLRPETLSKLEEFVLSTQSTSADQ